MQPGRSISAKGENFGPLLLLPCPQCDIPRWYNLVRHSSGFGLFGIMLTRSEGWSLHCEKCKYPVDITAEDATLALQLLPTSKKFYENVITEIEFNKQLVATNMNFLSTLAKVNTTWKCLRCNEESPNTFTECWKCGTVNPNADQSDQGADDVKTPNLDRALEDNGTNPYGGLKL